jgi:hypothetical protein
VDRLLASPHYGERWGRHWLDVVRYADTAGDNADFPIPQHYKYRNWVIRAFSEDKPYDEFIREQVAGDLLPSPTVEEKHQKIIATGYLANAKRFGSRVSDYPQHLTIEDTIDNLGRTFLGLTINCARCHDHKFDPVTVEDYYGLYGIFNSTRYPWPGIELEQRQRDLVPLVPAAQVEAAIGERDRKKASLEAAQKRLEEEKRAVDRALKESSGGDPAELARQKERSAQLVRELEAAKKDRELFPKTPLPFETAYAVAEGKKTGDVRIQIKGDPEQTGREVPRGFLAVLGGNRLPEEEKGSGRLELANWLADASNPLTARVMVNRIWLHHFGRGIVPTPSDFGRQGKPATHWELLDYLARRFIESGWSIKAMHRLIMLSRTYRLSSRDDAPNAAVDPANEWLWRFNRRRLDAESIRDAMLSIAGTLDETVGGPHPFPPSTSWAFTQHHPFVAVYETNRRSVYVMTQRIRKVPFFEVFDGADTNASTALRLTSTTPLQALFLMNDPFVHDQAKAFAARLEAGGPGDGGRVERAYLLALGRGPLAEERREALEYLSQVRRKLETSGVSPGERSKLSWESFARVLFRLNEFVYVP